MRSRWPLDVVALNPVSCGTVLWHAGGVLRVTVLVKATFAFGADGDAALRAPEPIEREDRHHDEDPSRSLRSASDTAPYLPGAGVVLTGHACAPGAAPVTALAARLAIFRDAPLLDKTIHVFGDIAPGSSAPGPFQTMPLVHERARGGPGFPWNPVGVSDAGDGAQADAMPAGVSPGRARPNLVNPANPHRPAAFGPIAPHWPLRKRLFGGVEPRPARLPSQPGSPGGDPAAAESAEVIEIPGDFDFRAFNPAPFDQQIPFLQGDEWIIVDGVNAGRARVQTRLPSARARVRRYRVSGAGVTGPQEIALSADMLAIDADRQIASLVWRGNFAIESLHVLQEVRLFAGVETATTTIPWPEPGDIAAPGQVRGGREGGAARVSAAPSSGAAPPQQEQGIHQRGAPAVSIPGSKALSAAMGRTGPLAKVEMPVLPFRGEPAAPQGQAEVAVSGGITGPLGQRMPIPEDMLAQVGAERARFPLAAPGTSAPREEAPIPGAPWSPVPAPPRVIPVGHRGVQDELTVDWPPPEPAAVASGLTPALRPAAPPRLDAPEPAPAPGELSGGPGPTKPPLVVSPPERVSLPVDAAPPASVEVAPPERVSWPVQMGLPASIEVAPPERVSLPAEVAPTEAVAPPATSRPLAALEARSRAEARLAEGRDLDGEDLSGGDLAGLDFSGRSLARCVLRGANLRGARFTGAMLVEAILEDADLRGADLSQAILTNARADRAALVEAALEGADLRGASLSGANLQKARLARARGDGANLGREQPGGGRSGGGALRGRVLRRRQPARGEGGARRLHVGAVRAR